MVISARSVVPFFEVTRARSVTTGSLLLLASLDAPMKVSSTLHQDDTPCGVSGQMDRVVPWQALCALIEPVYPKAGNGRQPVGLERMLRIYFLQNWFNLSDPAVEEALYDSQSMRELVGIDLGREAAPSSTKNQRKAHDPEMHQTRKGKQWYFGMKLHIGVDSRSGLAHSAVVTAANVHDKHPLPDLLHGNERRVYGDSAYQSQKALIAGKAPQARDFTNERTRRGGEVNEAKRAKNRNKSRIRARVEHVFAVIKRLWGFTKVRYRGLQKNATRAFIALALANIYLCRERLTPQVCP